MKQSVPGKIAVFLIALLVGTAALTQILHDESSALGLCSVHCKCTRCGWAQYPGRVCIDWTTWCAGPGLVRNCSSYCGAK